MIGKRLSILKYEDRRVLLAASRANACSRSIEPGIALCADATSGRIDSFIEGSAAIHSAFFLRNSSNEIEALSAERGWPATNRSVLSVWLAVNVFVATLRKRDTSLRTAKLRASSSSVERSANERFITVSAERGVT